MQARRSKSRFYLHSTLYKPSSTCRTAVGRFQLPARCDQNMLASLPWRCLSSNSSLFSPALELWNSLPDFIWDPTSSIDCFRRLLKNEGTRLDDSEMKGLRKTLWVSWTAKKTNEWVDNKAGVKRELLDTVKARKLAYYVHTMRKQGSCLEKEIINRTMPRACRRGRPRTAWMGNIKMWTGLPVEESIRMTKGRDKWRKYVHGVANPRIEDASEVTTLWRYTNLFIIIIIFFDPGTQFPRNEKMTLCNIKKYKNHHHYYYYKE